MNTMGNCSPSDLRGIRSQSSTLMAEGEPAMFTQFAELGSVLAERDGLSPCDLICQGFGEAYNRLVDLRFATDGSYCGWDWRELSTSEAAAMHYVKPSGARSPYLTPVAPFSGTPSEMVRRMSKGLKGIAEWAAEEEREDLAGQMASIAKTLDEIKGDIVSDLTEAQDRLADGDHRVAFQLCAADGDDFRPLGQYCIEDLVTRSVACAFGGTTDEEVILSPGCCILCGKDEDILYGNFSKLKTYILDQPGRIAGGFNFSEAARNFPVCPDCAIHAAYGIDVVIRDLSFRVFGIDYLIIPDTTADEVLLDFYDNAVRWRDERMSLKTDKLQFITQEEKEILDLIGEEFTDATTLSLTLVFFHSSDAQWRILAEVPEVLPSWLSKVYEAKRKVEAELPEERNLAVTLGVVLDATRQAQGSSNKEGERLFLQWTEAILRGGSLDRRAVMRIVVDYILREYREDTRRGEGQSPRGGFAALQGYLLVRLLEELTIIDGAGGDQMESLGSFESKWSQYLRERDDFFGVPESRVAFLTGALILQVASVQRRKRNLQRSEDAPIFKKVRGMRLDAKRLQSLLSEAKEKLLIYEADRFYSDLQELLSSEWTQVGDDWSLSTDETTFYFTLGLNLSWHINRPEAEEAEEVEAQ